MWSLKSLFPPHLVALLHTQTLALSSVCQDDSHLQLPSHKKGKNCNLWPAASLGINKRLMWHPGVSREGQGCSEPSWAPWKRKWCGRVQRGSNWAAGYREVSREQAQQPAAPAWPPSPGLRLCPLHPGFQSQPTPPGCHKGQHVWAAPQAPVLCQNQQTLAPLNLIPFHR